MGLRKVHPNFWLVVVADVVEMAWLGCAYLLVENTSPSFRFIDAFVPLRVWGAVFLAAAALVAYGVNRNPSVFRWGLVAGLMVHALFAFGFLTAIVTDLVARGDTPAAGSPGLFAFVTLCLLAQTGEPRSNPDAAKPHG